MNTRITPDVQVLVSWQHLDISNPPCCPGIYVITNHDMTKWFYVGKSNNIAKRIAVKNHPVQVTKDIALGQSYFYACTLPEDTGWFERRLIRKFDPEWNGSTSFSSACFTPWMCCDLPPSYSDEEVIAALGL